MIIIFVAEPYMKARKVTKRSAKPVIMKPKPDTMRKQPIDKVGQRPNHTIVQQKTHQVIQEPDNQLLTDTMVQGPTNAMVQGPTNAMVQGPSNAMVQGHTNTMEQQPIVLQSYQTKPATTALPTERDINQTKSSETFITAPVIVDQAAIPSSKTSRHQRTRSSSPSDRYEVARMKVTQWNTHRNSLPSRLEPHEPNRDQDIIANVHQEPR